MPIGQLTMTMIEKSSRFSNRVAIQWSSDNRLIPAAEWVRAFVAGEGWLPTEMEMQAYCTKTFGGDHVALIRQRPQWSDAWGIDGRDFMLCDSVPEWNLYYRSWDSRQTEVYSE